MRRRGGALIAAGYLALAAAGPALAEKRYVIEQLVVGVTSEAEGGDRVGTLKSGDSVEFLERSGEFARVQLASGAAGWVKASYLSSDPPLRERLAARERELEALRGELEALKAKGAGRVSAPPAVPPARPPAAAPAAAPAEPMGATAPALALAPAASGDPAPLIDPGRGSAPAGLVLGTAALGALGVGFGLGWLTLARRIRRKYGGLKIY